MRKGQGAPRVLTATMSNRPSVTDRLRQTRRLLTSEGAAGVSTRLRKRAAAALAPPGNARLPIAREDLVRAAEVAAGGWVLPAPAPHTPGEPLTVAWVCVPPSAASGGHTTMFRIVGGARARPATPASSTSTTATAGTSSSTGATIRAWWPWHRAPRCATSRDGIEDAHVDLRHQLADRVPGARLAGQGRALLLRRRTSSRRSTRPAARRCWPRRPTASASTASPPAAGCRRCCAADYGMQTDHFDFGCDLETYALDRSPGAESRRTGICYYCRPSTPRRAHELAIAALDLFAARHPEVDIHFYGEPPRQAALPRDRPRLPEPQAAQRALQPLRRRPGAVGHQRLAGPARDARRRLHPGGQRRRAQPHRARQRPRRATRRRRRSSWPTRSTRSSRTARPSASRPRAGAA